MAAEGTTRQKMPEWRSSAAIMDEAPVAMAVLEGGNLSVRYVNKAFCSLLDKTPEELLEKPIEALLPGNEILETLPGRVLSTGRAEGQTRHEEGGKHSNLWRYKSWPMAGGEECVALMIEVTESTAAYETRVAMNEALMLSAVRQHELNEASEKLNARLREEISERKQAEEALRESEKRYRTLFNSIDEGFCLIEMIFEEDKKPIDYRFLEVNPSFEKQSGLRDATGKRMRELAPDQESWWFETYGKVALSGEPVRFVQEARALENRWFDVYAFRLEGPGTGKVAVLFRNITARKRMEEALEIAKEQLARHAGDLEKKVEERTAGLREAIKSLESLTYTMAHDLSAPIRAMRTLTLALLEDVPLNAEGVVYAERINTAAERMSQLINDLLDYGQLTHLEFPVQPIELGAQIERALEGVADPIGATGAQIELRKPFPVIVGNETLVNQVLTNLLSNALKFVGPGVKPAIVIRGERRGKMARIWVEDNGIGILPEHQERIFRLFQRLHPAEEFRGTGVGLAIVKSAVERLHGKVGVESERGRGSRFWVELPAVEEKLDPYDDGRAYGLWIQKNPHELNT